MNLQAILDRFEFRPEPAATLTETVSDLRVATRVLHDAVTAEGRLPGASERSAALRTATDRIETAHGIIEAHGFGGPIVDRAADRGDEAMDWVDIAAIVGGEGQLTDDLGEALKRANDEFAAADITTVTERFEADRLALLGRVPDSLPSPTEADPPDRPALRRALLLIAAVAYFLAGFGTHPDDIPPDAERVAAGFWIIAAVLVAGNDGAD